MEKRDITDIQFKSLCWAIGILIIGIGWLFTCYAGLSARVQAISDYQGNINTKLEVISNDLVWIKEYMKENSSSFTEFNQISNKL